MATNISVEYDLPLPNDYMVDHAFTDGKTRKSTYDGPDKIWLQIGADGTEKAGPLNEDDILDGRPMPADVVEWYEVDCATNPLICQLRGMPIDEKEEDYTDSATCSITPAVSGYPQCTYGTPLMPGDIYDRDSVKVVGGTVTIQPFTAIGKLLDRETDLTWDDIRKHRNNALQACDGKVTEDMPTDLKDKWKTYRQKLRDFPATMAGASVTPNGAYYMMPLSPDDEVLPTDGGLAIA